VIRTKSSSLASLIEDAQIAAQLEADVGCTLNVASVDPVHCGSRPIRLLGSLGNLLSNAFRVHTSSYDCAFDCRMRWMIAFFIDVEDKCGGLAPNFLSKRCSNPSLS
jgi:hypothetical protein